MTDVTRLSLPLTLWIISFSAIYGLHGLACAGGWALEEGPAGLSWGRAVLLAAGLAAVAVQALGVLALARPPWGAPPGFLRRTSLSLAVVSLLATAWTALPVAVLPLCGP
jgi:hypothetical protein